MVFKRGDIYTSSGSTKLFNSWTPYVSKFDTSSFYNWEQDNLPLYDLEERTYELWEQAGFPTSAVPGLSLTVSADTAAATLQADTTIFTTVSSCIAAIPKIVRFPVLIEVCNFGDLGALELHNFRIEEAGSIEIINRAYSKVYNASATASVIDTSIKYNNFANLVEQFDSEDVSATLFSSIGADDCTSSLALSTTVLSGGGDIRVSAVNSFLYLRFTLREAPLNVGLAYAGQTFFTNTLNRFKVDPYENNATQAQDATLQTLDISATTQASSAEIKRDFISASQNLGGSIYLNSCSRISVQNCDGPIYIRNFHVNGESAAAYGGREIGIEIINSNVFLENCAAVRCREAGFKFNNSKVVLSRSAFAYRNYELPNATTRTSKKGIGFHAINSDVSISALVTGDPEIGAGDFQASGDDVIVVTSRNYAGFKLDNSKLHGGLQRLISTNAATGGMLSCGQNTGYGMLLNNSQINLKGLIDIYGNSRGIKADNSKITYEELCVEDQSNEGLTSKNSDIIFDSANSFTDAGQQTRKQVDFKQNSQHLDLEKNSSFSFERKNNMPVLYGCMSFSGAHGIVQWDGGRQANVPAISVRDNSDAEFINCKLIARSTGGDNTVGGSPTYGFAAKAINSSKLSFFGTGSGCSLVWGPTGFSNQKYNSGLYAGKQSTLNLHGPTVIAQFGVDILAEDQSTINIEPPRVKGGWGYDGSGFNLGSTENHTSVELHSTRACIGVNKNSTLNMTDLGAWLGFWDTSAIGQTRLADGNDYLMETDFNGSSLIKAGSMQFYPNPFDSGSVDDSQLASVYGALGAGSVADFPIFTSYAKTNTFLITSDPADGPGNRSIISKGGMCVRATQDSVVNVKNVHFPSGNQDSTLDGTYYNASGNTCEMLMIWNMADTSRLNASYCSVSGVYPADASYQGPSSLWMSSAPDGLVAGTDYVAASGAPVGTPDTGSLSVLDTFGAGSAIWVIPSGVGFNQNFGRFYPVDSATTHSQGLRLEEAGINVSGFTAYNSGASANLVNNKGVFRIYWSPKSSSRFLQNDEGGYVSGSYPYRLDGGIFVGALGAVPQVFAQGYNMSGPVSAIVPTGLPNVSGTYPELLKLSFDTNGDGIADELWTSGFYYCGEFVEDNPSQCMLDESASDTFANSKNATLGWSGKPRKVTICNSRGSTTSGSESFQGTTIGIKSVNIFDLERNV